MSGGKGGSPSGFTTTTQTANTAPWAPQQPYLQQAFQGAQNLYQGPGPQYFPNSTVIPPDWIQTLGLQGIQNAATRWGGTPADAAQNALLGSLSGQGTFSGNPAVNPLTNLSGTNLGLNNPGTSTLENIAQGIPGISTAQNLATNSIAPAEATLASGLAPAFGTLGQFASGANTDPFLGGLAQSVLSSVVPSVEAPFIAGGGLSRSAAPYAAAQGATAALAPIMSNAFLQEQQNQLAAAGALGNLGISGAGAAQNLMLNPAQMYGNLALGGAGLQSSAASGLGNLALGGGGLQAQQLGDISQAYNTAMGQQLQAEGLYPSVQQGAFMPGQMMYGAGAQWQNQMQNLLNADISRWNYNQTLPYQQLNSFLQQIGGNYGGTGTGTTTQPYYTNRGANILGDILGLGAGANALFGSGGGGGILGSLPVASSLIDEGALGGMFSSGAAGSGILGTIGSLLPFFAAA